jgi:competence protein ComEC
MLRETLAGRARRETGAHQLQSTEHRAVRSLLLLAGILVALWMPPAHQPLLGWCLLALGLPLLAWRRVRPVLLAVAGAAGALLIVRQVTAPPALEAGERVLVHARVLDIPAVDESGWQFDAQIRFARHPEWPAQRWRLRLPAAMKGPAAGELWQYAVRFDPPRDAAERRMLLRARIGAQARLVEGAFNERLEPAGRSVDGLRAWLARRIGDRVADPAAAALLPALAVGVTGDVSARQWQVFNATGITHLVAISGMHVTFFAMLCMAGARRLWPLLATLPAMPRRERFAAIVGITLAACYALLSGFSVPAQRTVVMLAAWVVARQCQRCCQPAWSVAAALVAVLVFDPLAALSAGFWLSFLAVAAIVLLEGVRILPGAPLRIAIRVQWLVTIVLLPVTVSIFGSFSAVGLLANALAIPVFTLALVPVVLLATACYLVPGVLAGWCGDRLVDLATLLAQWLWPFLSWCADLPAALWRIDAPASWFLLAAPAVLLAVLPLARVPRILALGLLGAVFLLRDPRPRTGELWIDVPDAGRSGAVMLRTRGSLMLWGTGESFGARGRAFSRHVQPLLRSSGYGALDLWLPGSLSRDVQAALALGVTTMPVRRVLLPPARGVPPEMQPCVPMHWEQDGVAFDLQPSADGRACSLRASAADHALVLGGGGATQLAPTSGAVLRLVLDAGGIRQRRRDLRL